jgi:hypothetical protein
MDVINISLTFEGMENLGLPLRMALGTWKILNLTLNENR